MFNILIPAHELFFTTLSSFFIFFVIRRLLIKRSIFIIFYHISLFCILFIATIGGGGVQNAGYEKLERLIALERNNRLEEIKSNPKHHDLQIELECFDNTNEFRNYLQKNDKAVDTSEAISISWILALTAEVALVFSVLFKRFYSKVRNKLN